MRALKLIFGFIPFYLSNLVIGYKDVIRLSFLLFGIPLVFAGLGVDININFEAIEQASQWAFDLTKGYGYEDKTGKFLGFLILGFTIYVVYKTIILVFAYLFHLLDL